MNHEQQNLFQEPAGQDEIQIDIAAMAEHIAANARFTEVPDRTSEAARDQGWGPVSTESKVESAPTASPRGKVSRNTLSSQGKLMADREPDTQHNPIYQDNTPLSDEQKEINRRGYEELQSNFAAQKARRAKNMHGRVSG